MGIYHCYEGVAKVKFITSQLSICKLSTLEKSKEKAIP